MKIAILTQEPFSFDSRSAASLRAKAFGMAERGHQVWVLAPASTGSDIREAKGVHLVALPFDATSLSEDSTPWMSSWKAALVGELVRWHRGQWLDIVDVPSGLTGICPLLSGAMGMDRLPALVQVGGKLSGMEGPKDVRTTLYHLEGELDFTSAHSIDAHIAILRLENFFHGVLNRHYEAQRPAA